MPDKSMQPTLPKHFNNSLSDHIPMEWDIVKLGDVFSMKAGKFLSSEQIKGIGLYPVFGANGIRGFTSTYTHEGPHALIGRQGALCGNIVVAAGKFYATEHAVVVTPNEQMSVGWIVSYLTKMNLNRFSESSAQPGLSVQKLVHHRIRMPKFPEQTRIAYVLETIDEAIAKTEAVIEKLKQVRAGMLHDLLSYGLDAHGQLRDPIAHPDQFKSSPLGRIPKEWEIDHLINRISLPEGQVDPRISPYSDWILVAPDHIESATGRLLERKTAKEQGVISGKYVFEPSDIVYSKIRPYLRKAVLATEQGLCSADMYPLRPKSGVNPTFLLTIILNESFSRFASAVSMRSGFPKINRKELAEFLMSWPPLEEQNLIAEKVDIVDSQQKLEQLALQKLKKLKSGLQDDLLTGRVRVPESIMEGAAVV